MFMDFIAHKTDDRTQMLESHIDGSTKIARRIGRKCGIENIVALCAMIHDTGKATADFQNYIIGNSTSAGEHAYSGAKLLKELFKADDAYSKALNELVSKAVACHHSVQDFTDGIGNPIVSSSIDYANNYKEAKDNILNILNLEELNSVYASAKEEIKEVVSKITYLTQETVKAGNGLKSKQIFNFYMGLIVRLVLSIIRYADMQDCINFNNNYVATHSVNWETPLEKLEEAYIEFAKSDNPINKMRNNISERALRSTDHQARICTLSMPTGAGKTLTSLRYALNYSYKYNKERIFYVAPFLSILGPNAEVMKKYMGREMLEHHSDVQVDDADTKYFELCETWDNISMVATSFVQFFNALTKDNASNIWKFHSLINSVIILDEVQEIPVNYSYIVNLIFNFLSCFMGATIVLCSASIPPFDKQHIPMLIDKNHSITGDPEEDFRFFKKVECFILPSINRPLTKEEIECYCKSIYEDSENLLIIANTKKAVEYFKCILEQFVPEENLYLLSTRKCSQHLKEDIQTIKERLKKKDKIVCVSTQLIEAGVDISFHTGIRTMCGLDSLLQTEGRVNRNAEYLTSKLYIFNIGTNSGIENLHKLPYIKNGIINTTEVLSKKKTKDIINQTTLTDYFKDVYGTRCGYTINMNRYAGYIEEEDCCLFDYLAKSYSHSNELFNQRLKSFGEGFNLIDNYANPVIINYDSAATEIINKIETDSLTKSDIRKSYRYTVGLNDVELSFYVDKGIVKYSERYKIYYLQNIDKLYTSQFGMLFDNPF